MAEFKATSICLFYKKRTLARVRNEFEMSVDDLLMELCRLQRLFENPSQSTILGG